MAPLTLTIDTQFDSTASTPHTYPADPNIAVGTDSIIVVGNTRCAIYTKVGAQMVNGEQKTLFGTKTNGGNAWIIYDIFSKRFFVIGIFGDNNNRLAVAVSKTSKPLNLTTSWHKYVLDNVHVTSACKIGTGPNDYVYVTYRYGSNNQVKVYRKSTMLNGKFDSEKDTLNRACFNVFTVSYKVSDNHSFHTLCVPHMYDDESPFGFVVGLNPKTRKIEIIRHDAINNTLCKYIVRIMPDFIMPRPGVPCLGSNKKLNNYYAIKSAAIKGGFLWLSHEISAPDKIRTILRWYKIDIRQDPYDVVQYGDIDPGPGLSAFMSHINVNRDLEMVICFTVCGSTIYPRIAVTGKQHADFPGTSVRPIVTVKDSTGATPSTSKWGSYAGLAVDPVDGDFWSCSAYIDGAKVHRLYVAEVQFK